MSRLRPKSFNRSLHEDFIAVQESFDQAYLRNQKLDKLERKKGPLAKIGKLLTRGLDAESRSLLATGNDRDLWRRVLLTKGNTFELEGTRVVDHITKKLGYEVDSGFVMQIDNENGVKPVLMPHKLREHYRNMALNPKNNLNPEIFGAPEVYVGFTSFIGEEQEGAQDNNFVKVEFYTMKHCGYSEEMNRPEVLSYDRESFEALEVEEQMLIAATPGAIAAELEHGRHATGYSRERQEIYQEER